MLTVDQFEHKYYTPKLSHRIVIRSVNNIDWGAQSLYAVTQQTMTWAGEGGQTPQKEPRPLCLALGGQGLPVRSHFLSGSQPTAAQHQGAVRGLRTPDIAHSC